MRSLLAVLLCALMASTLAAPYAQPGPLTVNLRPVTQRPSQGGFLSCVIPGRPDLSKQCADNKMKQDLVNTLLKP